MDRETMRERERGAIMSKRDRAISYVAVTRQISRDFMVAQTQFLKLISEKQLLRSDVDAPRLTRYFKGQRATV